MSTYVDFEMCLLVETLVAVGDNTLVTLPWLMGDLGLLLHRNEYM
jgi:hypothetical protein